MSVRKNSLYNLAGSLIPLAIAIVTIPLYLEVIGAEKYGVLSLAFLFLGYFGLFDLGLSKATTYRLSQLATGSREDRFTTLSTAVLLNLSIGVAGAGFAYVLARVFFLDVFEASGVLRREVTTSLPLLAICLPVATLTGVLTGALHSAHRFLQTNLISVLSTALFQLLPLGMALFVGDEITLLLGAALAARVVATLALAISCLREFGHSKAPYFSLSEVKSLVAYGGWIIFDSLLAPMVSMVDRFVIGAAYGGAAVSTYSIPYQFAQRLTIVPSALMLAIFPKLPNANEEVRRRIARQSVSVLIAALSFPVCIAIFASEPFFIFWIGPGIGAEAARVAVVILLGFWFNAVSWAPYTWLQGTGRPAVVTLIHLAEVLPYFAVLYFGLHWAGLVGVALAFLFRNAMDFTLLCAAVSVRRQLVQALGFAALLGLSIAGSLYVEALSLLWLLLLLSLSTTIALLSWFVLPPDVQAGLRRSLASWLQANKTKRF